MRASTKRTLRIQLLIFLGLFILAEIILRLCGMKAGTLMDDFDTSVPPVYQPRFFSDEKGINHIIDNPPMLMLGTVINAQGFRSRISYTKAAVDSIRAKNKEVLMIIGDSFVEGCCADTVTNSFPDLIGRDPAYGVLNFGVAGTDPLQYALVAEKYVAELRPDRVVIVVYLGNDIIISPRTPTPGIPLTYPFRNNKWLYAVAPDNLSGRFNQVLATPAEAYRFYLRHYTLKGDNRNLFEKTLGYSVIFSKLYLFAEHQLATRRWQKANSGYQVDVTKATHDNLARIAAACKKAGVPCLFVAIPAPSEAGDPAGTRQAYTRYFKEIPWHLPSGLKRSDYDGNGVGNHFNNEGHKKYAAFLQDLLKAGADSHR